MNTKNTMMYLLRKYLVLTYKNLDTYLVNTKNKTNEITMVYNEPPLYSPHARAVVASTSGSFFFS